jgi:ABC-type phosphate/phosphonate transport system permease subunit
MQQAVQRGLRAGTLAGLLLVGIFFVDYGPATSLTTIAHWFALDGNPWSKLIGAILLVMLGAVFGGLFAALVRLWSSSQFHSVLIGLVTGLCWWVLLVLLLSTVVRHIQQSLYGTLFWLVISLLYGLVLGSLYG